MAVLFPFSSDKKAAARETLVQRFLRAAALLVGPSLDQWRHPQAPPIGLSFTSGVPSCWRRNNVVKSSRRRISPKSTAMRIAAVRRIWSQKLRSYCAVRKNRQGADFSGESGAALRRGV